MVREAQRASRNRRGLSNLLLYSPSELVRSLWPHNQRPKRHWSAAELGASLAGAILHSFMEFINASFADVRFVGVMELRTVSSQDSSINRSSIFPCTTLSCRKDLSFKTAMFKAE